MRNRTEGHGWERECAKRIQKSIGARITTSRYSSRELDDAKVDLVTPLPYYFQCKSLCRRVPYDILLKEMPTERIPVLLTKLTKKKGKRFYKQGEYAILPMNDFLKLIADDYTRTNTRRDSPSKPK